MASPAKKDSHGHLLLASDATEFPQTQNTGPSRNSIRITRRDRSLAAALLATIDWHFRDAGDGQGRGSVPGTCIGGTYSAAYIWSARGRRHAYCSPRHCCSLAANLRVSQSGLGDAAPPPAGGTTWATRTAILEATRKATCCSEDMQRAE